MLAIAHFAHTTPWASNVNPLLSHRGHHHHHYSHQRTPPHPRHVTNIIIFIIFCHHNYHYLVKSDFLVVFCNALPHTATDLATQYYVISSAPLGTGTHSSPVSRTMPTCRYLCPRPMISIVSDLSSLFPYNVNKCLQAIDSSLDSSLLSLSLSSSPGASPS